MSKAFDACQMPAWLLKHTSEEYMNTVYHTLAGREKERRIACRLSQTPKTRVAPSTSTNKNSILSCFKMSKFSSTTKELTGSTSSYYSTATAFSSENQHRNRYMDIGPYDRTRVQVKLTTTNGDVSVSETGYLNASWVLERFGHKWWMASQAPLPHTAHAFLSVLLRPVLIPPVFISPPPSVPRKTTRIRTIVQLTMDIEDGRRKAHPYFPSEAGKPHIILPDDDGGAAVAIKVTLLCSTSIREASCIKSILRVVPVERGENIEVERLSEAVVIQHLLYTSWPDHGVPNSEDRNSLLTFISLVDSTNRDISSVPIPTSSDFDPDPPIIVGCSAGIGRTGSFIALSSLLRFFGKLPAAHMPTPPSVLQPSPLGTLPSSLDEDLIAQEVDSMREQRMGMVQRDEQILLIYETLTRGLNTGTAS